MVLSTSKPGERDGRFLPSKLFIKTHTQNKGLESENQCRVVCLLDRPNYLLKMSDSRCRKLLKSAYYIIC
jgi:hypothetical protein